MKTFMAFPVFALAAACVPSDPIELTAAEESELSVALAGRVAGQPVSCVNLRDIRGNRSVGEGVILFEGTGGTVYVNRPPAGCPDLRDTRTLITRTSSTQLCRGDIARVADLPSDMEYGSCGLGDFTPYRRVR
jgi:hypothetical protein